MAIRRVNLRKSHPNKYRALTWFAAFHVFLAVNFWRYTPAFNPEVLIFTPSKNLVAVVFLVLGVLQLVFLNLFRNLGMVRLVTSVSVAVTCCWGLVNSQQAFSGSASLQLPGTLIALCGAQVLWLIEAPVNPLTERGP